MFQYRRTIAILIILIILLVAGDIYAGAIDFDPNIYIDNEKIDFNLQIKIKDGRTIIPFREFMNYLDFQIDYKGDTNEILAVNETEKIYINLDEKNIVINDDFKYIDQDIDFYKDSLYISLRPLVEGLSANISWFGNENKIMIDLEEAKDSKSYSRIENINTSQVLELGMTYDEIIAILGNPNRLDHGKLASNWLIYHYNYENYNDYIKLKLKNNELVEIETMGSNWKIIDDLGVGTKLENIDPIIEKYDENDIMLEIEESAGEVSFINIKEKKYDIALDTDLKNIVLDPYEDAVLESMEKQIFDYLNIYRLKNERGILIHHEDLNQIAREHSRDMGDNDYYGYLNSNGETFENRLTEIASENGFTSGAENILAGINMPKDVVNMWINSEIYRNQILEEFHYVGIGVYFKLESRYGLYFTVDFAGVGI